MSTVLTETRHAGGYIVYEEDMSYSREQIAVRGGQGVLEAGQVLYNGGSAYLKQDGSQDTIGHFTHAPAAILYETIDTGADHAVKFQATVTKRNTTVNLSELYFPAESTTGGEQAATVAGLLALGIVCR